MVREKKKVGKQVRKPMRYGGITCKTSQTNHIKSGRNYIEISTLKTGYSENITTKRISCNDHKLPQRMKRTSENNKTKRNAQVSFQAKIDASGGSTTARSESREIQIQQLMPVRVSR